MHFDRLKTGIGLLAVTALIFNSYYAYMVFGGGGGAGWLGGPKTGGGESLGAIKVQVPPTKLYDLIIYDYSVFAQSYTKNMSSGDYEDYQLKIQGQLKRSYPDIVEQARDGFWVPHRAAEFDTDTTAVFTVSVDTSDGQPLSIGGNLEIKRKEYIELNSRKPVNSLTDAQLEIDRLPKYNVPLSFSGLMDSYPDPNRKLDETVDQNIFAGGQTVNTGENGTFIIDTDYGGEFTIGTHYNWSAEAGEKVSDFKALRLNISADLFGQETGNASESFFWFNETVWISNDCPFPVKRFTSINQTFQDTDRSGNVILSRLVLETTNTVIKGGLSRGTVEMPWGDPQQADFSQRHPRGEFSGWQYAPADGAGLPGSSFPFGIDEAVSEAQANSSGLQNFIGKYNRPGRNVLVSGATFNGTPDPTDPNGLAGTYRWNLTFGVSPDRYEYDEARQNGDYNFSYCVVVTDTITREIEKLRTVYKHHVGIENDWGPVRGSSPFNREALDPEGCTLSSSEEILMLDEQIKTSVTNTFTGKIDWKESKYMLGAAGLGGSGAGFQMIETLTGMTFPTADHAWAVQTQTIYEQGHTFMAAVDVETGRLVYVTDIKGTALLGIFG